MKQPEKKRQRASGAGVKADDGAKDLVRKQVLLDAGAEAVFLGIGDGNLSLGIREAARRLLEAGDDGLFDPKRHQTRISQN